MSLERVKNDVEELKKTTTTVLNALGENAVAVKENTKIVNKMLIELRERDVRDEYRTKEISTINERITRTENTLIDYKEKYKEPLAKLITSQHNWSNFWSSVNSTWGKMFAVAFVIAFAYAVEIDLSRLLGK